MGFNSAFKGLSVYVIFCESKKILLLKKAEKKEYSAIGTSDNDLNWPHVKQSYYRQTEN